MNQNLIKVAIFVAGASIGAGVAYVVTKKRYEQIVEEELESMKEYILNGLQETEDEVSATSEVYQDERVVPFNPRYKKILGQYSGDIEASKAMADVVEVERDEEEDYEEYEQKSYASNQYKKENPYVISIEEFSEEMDHYDKVTVYFYEDDEVLADENEEVITDMDGTVGRDNMGFFGEGSNDPEVVYIRNEKLEIDYEVIRLSKSYSETVLGMEPVEEGRAVRRRDRDED